MRSVRMASIADDTRRRKIARGRNPCTADRCTGRSCNGQFTGTGQPDQTKVHAVFPVLLQLAEQRFHLRARVVIALLFGCRDARGKDAARFVLA